MATVTSAHGNGRAVRVHGNSWTPYHGSSSGTAPCLPTERCTPGMVSEPSRAALIVQVPRPLAHVAQQMARGAIVRRTGSAQQTAGVYGMFRSATTSRHLVLLKQTCISARSMSGCCVTKDSHRDARSSPRGWPAALRHETRPARHQSCRLSL